MSYYNSGNNNGNNGNSHNTTRGSGKPRPAVERGGSGSSLNSYDSRDLGERGRSGSGGSSGSAESGVRVGRAPSSGPGSTLFVIPDGEEEEAGGGGAAGGAGGQAGGGELNALARARLEQEGGLDGVGGGRTVRLVPPVGVPVH